MTTRPPRKSAKERAEAVGLAVVIGQTKAAEQLGIPLSTINRWWNDPVNGSYRESKREDMADALRIGFFMGLRRIIALIPDEMDLGKLNATTGTIFDKLALLEGRATERTEHRTLDDLSDAAVALLDAAFVDGEKRAAVVAHHDGNGASGRDALSAVPVSGGDTGRPGDEEAHPQG